MGYKIRVKEGTDPIGTIRPKDDSGLVDVTAGAWTFIVKADPTTPDVDALFTLTSAGGDLTVVQDDSGNDVLQASFSAANLTPPGEYIWRLDRVLLSKTTIWGPHEFIIEDV